MPEQDIDLRLVKRVQEGDKKAFDLLVLKYQRKVMSIIARLVRQPAEIEDIAQETFIKAYRAIPNFKGESAFYTWLYRIAINCTHSYVEKHLKRSLLPDEKISLDEGTLTINPSLIDSHTPESNFVNQEIVQVIQQSLSELPDELRQALELRELEGLSYDAIAAQMQTPIGTVRSRIFRAREAIAARLKPVLLQGGEKRW
ncbi:MAG: RNA polymerase sigma factor RpoE [Pelistega sp.]|nr:RNA polymerase sigma factor RpoE [Pelistega sp.]